MEFNITRNEHYSALVAALREETSRYADWMRVSPPAVSGVAEGAQEWPLDVIEEKRTAYEAAHAERKRLEQLVFVN